MEPEHISAIKQVVVSAGEKLLEYWPGGDPAHQLGDQRKADGSIVTAGDFASNDILIEGLSKLYPEDAFYSEEGEGLTSSEAQSVWVIDPLDGTKYFAKGTDGFCILVARATEHIAEYGVCSFPVQGLYAEGSKDGGSTLNDEKLAVSSSTRIEDSSVFVKNISDAHPSFYCDTALHPAFHFFKLCKGEIDGLVIKIQKHQEWDLAPYIPILLGAGGEATDEKGNLPEFHFGKPRFKYLVGSNGHIHEELLSAL